MIIFLVKRTNSLLWGSLPLATPIPMCAWESILRMIHVTCQNANDLQYLEFDRDI